MPKFSGVSDDPVTGLRWGKATFAEKRRYPFAQGGRLLGLATRVGDYLSAQAAGMEIGPLVLEGQGLGINTTNQDFTIDSSWRVGPAGVGPLPENQNPAEEAWVAGGTGAAETMAIDSADESPFSGELRVRIVAKGKPNGVKPPKRTLATNYNRVKEHAIGISYDPLGTQFDDYFNSDLILHYKSSGKQYTLKSLPSRPLSEFFNSASLVGFSAVGQSSWLFAGPIDLSDPAKQLDRQNFAFAANFQGGWHTAAAGWLA